MPGRHCEVPGFGRAAASRPGRLDALLESPPSGGAHIWSAQRSATLAYAQARTPAHTLSVDDAFDAAEHDCVALSPAGPNDYHHFPGPAHGSSAGWPLSRRMGGLAAAYCNPDRVHWHFGHHPARLRGVSPCIPLGARVHALLLPVYSSHALSRRLRHIRGHTALFNPRWHGLAGAVGHRRLGMADERLYVGGADVARYLGRPGPLSSDCRPPLGARTDQRTLHPRSARGRDRDRLSRLWRSAGRVDDHRLSHHRGIGDLPVAKGADDGSREIVKSRQFTATSASRARTRSDRAAARGVTVPLRGSTLAQRRWFPDRNL